MALILEFGEGLDSNVKREIEGAIRKRIGETPAEERWTVSITAGFARSYCEVQVVTPNQTRTRLFFEEPANLPKAIADWIGLYPLR